MKQPPMTIRLDEGTKTRLKSASHRLKLSSSALIRLGLVKLLAEQDTGTIRIPASTHSASN